MILGDFGRQKETNTQVKREKEMLRMLGHGTDVKIQTERVAE